MLNEAEKEIPTSFYWTLEIINDKITEYQSNIFQNRVQEIFGDCANPLSQEKDKDYIGMAYIDFDDFEVFKLLTKILNDKNTIIRVYKLTNERTHAFTIEYSGCRIINIKNNLKYNGDKEPLTDNIVYFDYKKRKVLL